MTDQFDRAVLFDQPRVTDASTLISELMPWIDLMPTGWIGSIYVAPKVVLYICRPCCTDSPGGAGDTSDCAQSEPPIPEMSRTC